MEFEPPKEIKIGNYLYTKKDKLSGDNYSYRCKYRKVCKLQITINKSELLNIINKSSNTIKYIISSKNNKEHSCNNNAQKEQKEEIKEENVSLSAKSLKQKAKELIFRNLDKPLSFHLENLKNNNFKLSKNQIKWILQILREQNYPSDANYLFNIDKIKIEIDNEQIPFCFSYYSNIFYEKHYICDKYFIITSPFQINMFSKCNQLFFDATFKSCPKSMYEIFNIAGFFKDIDGIIPLMYIPMSNKSERLYTIVLDNVLKILKLFNIDINSITNLMMSDFEIALRNSIKNSFPQAILDGCFFHYSKLLWKYAKRLGLCSKNNLKKTKLFIFLLKIFPYIKLDEKKEYFTEIDEHFKIDNKYNKFLIYYKNNWLNSSFVNMDVINRDEYLNRTNNYLESFHHALNNTIESFHPRISYLVEKLRTITINKYEEYKNSINPLASSVQSPYT